MPLLPIKEHRLMGKSYTDLAQDYAELAQRPNWQGEGNAMLEFVSMVNETFKETYLFGFTSHWDLVLNPVDCRYMGKKRYYRFSFVQQE